jgi:hypothetical protein
MPWWAISYLGVYLLLFVFAMYDDIKRPNTRYYISTNIVCAAFAIFFISAYFNQAVYTLLGPSILILVGIGILIEIISSQRDLLEIKKDPELSGLEHQFVIVFPMLFGILIVIPGYLFGILAFMKYK